MARTVDHGRGLGSTDTPLVIPRMHGHITVPGPPLAMKRLLPAANSWVFVVRVRTSTSEPWLMRFRPYFDPDTNPLVHLQDRHPFDPAAARSIRYKAQVKR